MKFKQCTDILLFYAFYKIGSNNKDYQRFMVKYDSLSECLK